MQSSGPVPCRTLTGSAADLTRTIKSRPGDNGKVKTQRKRVTNRRIKWKLQTRRGAVQFRGNGREKTQGTAKKMGKERTGHAGCSTNVGLL